MRKQRKDIAKAIKTGQQQARLVLAERHVALRKRAVAMAKPAPRRLAKSVQPIPANLFEAAGGLGSVGTIVAEGDSWFDYPGTDVLGELQDKHAYEVESVAHAGDRVESMAYGEGQLTDFARRLEKVIRQGTIPAAILLSGGGNDVAGKEFHMLLDHKLSPNPGLNARVVEGILQQRVLLSYAHWISKVTSICEDKLGRPVRIIVHGYDHPVPDGRGFWGGFWFLPGPWLKPGFIAKGYEDMNERIKIARELIDRFNDVVESLPQLSGFAHVRYVDIRGTLTKHPGDKRLWANELHPKPRGFSLVANKFAEAIAAP